RDRALQPRDGFGRQRAGGQQRVELVLQRGEVLADAVVQLAREPAPLLLLHAPDRAREVLEMALAALHRVEHLFLLRAQQRELLLDARFLAAARVAFGLERCWGHGADLMERSR